MGDEQYCDGARHGTPPAPKDREGNGPVKPNPMFCARAKGQLRQTSTPKSLA